MRIAMISQSFWPEVGGAQIQMRLLASEWARTGHDVSVLTCRWQQEWAAEEVVDGYRVIRLPATRVRFLGTLRLYAQIRSWMRARHREFDVVFVSMLKHAAHAAVVAGEPVGLPVYLKAEGGGATGDIAWQEKANFGRMVRRGTLGARRVFAPGQAVASEVMAAGYPQVEIIANGIQLPDRSWCEEEVSAHRARLGLPDRRTLMTTGRLSPEKGLLDLIAAMPSILKTLGDIQLVIVGEGVERSRIERAVRANGLANHVLLVGEVQDVVPYLLGADLYVLPSHAEGLSLGLLEALAMCLPAVASDLEANHGIVPQEALPKFASGESEQLVRAVMQSFEDRETMIRRSSAFGPIVREGYGIEAVARQYIERFEALD